MPNPTTLNQTIAQAVQCVNKIFEQHKKKHWEPLPFQKKFRPTTPSLPMAFL
jgi:hypothetical protein